MYILYLHAMDIDDSSTVLSPPLLENMCCCTRLMFDEQSQLCTRISVFYRPTSMIGVTHNVTDANNDCPALTGNEVALVDTVCPSISEQYSTTFVHTRRTMYHSSHFVVSVDPQVPSQLKTLIYISPVQYSTRNTLPSYQSTHIQQQGTSFSDKA